MRFLCGKMNKTISILIFILMSVHLISYAENTDIEFRLGSADCGGTVVSATVGEGTLRASADGINSEKIKWDSDESILAPRMQGKKLANGWGVGGYWLIEFSGKDMTNPTFSADMFSSGKAPKYFELRYSVNGVDYKTADNSRVALSKTNRTVYDGFLLPSEIGGAERVYIKLVICSDESVNGSSVSGVKDGSTYINNIIISGGSAKPDDGKTDDDKPATERSVFYQKSENIQMQRVGLLTGKFRFSVKIK